MTYLKKLLPLVWLITFTPKVGVYAHSGRTDSQGGHNDHISGGYHFHHGERPHQHPNGVCPLKKESSWELPYYFEDVLTYIFTIVLITCLIVFVIEQDPPKQRSFRTHFLIRALQVSGYCLLVEVIKKIF